MDASSASFSFSILMAFSLASAVAVSCSAVFILYRRWRRALDLHRASMSHVRSLEHERNYLLSQLHLLNRQVDEVRALLERRPDYQRMLYNIVNVGAPGCGKTHLTFKWANPIYKGEFVGTRFEHYERTVSSRQADGVNVDHVFEILDWGGEFINEAQAALVRMQAIHAMLMVVDLGKPQGNDPRAPHVFDEARIRAQIEQLNTYVLQFFFAPVVTKHCKTYVLFINKSDLISGFPQDVERRALEFYRPLIDTMMTHGEKAGVSVKVFVGSAETGINTGQLFGHLIEHILLPEDYDEQLRAKLRAGGAPRATPEAAQQR